MSPDPLSPSQREAIHEVRALLAEAEAERDEARATKDMHKERQEEAWAERDALRAEVDRLDHRFNVFDAENRALRAELAAKDAEVASLKAEIPARMLRFPQRRLGYRILSLEHELAAEKAAHEKSEARVRELEDRIAGFAVIPGGHFPRNSERYSNAREWLEREGCAILAARARKEGWSRG